MTTNHPTELDLDEIEARAAHLWEYVELPAEADHLAGKDVPALLDEVRRLRAENAELTEARRLEWVMSQSHTPHTPRICECGHSHHAHTVPAPHSCFAHGKTCECPAYRQMSHDDAVAHQKRKQAEYAARPSA